MDDEQTTAADGPHGNCVELDARELDLCRLLVNDAKEIFQV